LKVFLTMLLLTFSFTSFSQATKVFINDTYWKKKIPNWKDYYMESQGSKKVAQPSCTDAAEGMIKGYTAERNALKAKKAKWYNIISPLVNYAKSGFIYYTKQRGFEKYKKLIEEASVVVSGKDHVIKTKSFDHFAKKVLKKAVQDSVTLKNYKLNNKGSYTVIPNSQNKDVKLKKTNKLLVATNLLLGDASGYFCSFDVGVSDKEKVYNNVFILKKSAVVALFHSGPMKSRKFFAAAKKFEELRLYTKYLKERKKITTGPAGYAKHWKTIAMKKQNKLRQGYEKKLKVILMEADDKLMATQFNKLIDNLDANHWKKDLEDY